MDSIIDAAATTDQTADAAFDAAFSAAPQAMAVESSTPTQAEPKQSGEAKDDGVIDLSDPSLQSAIPNYDPEADYSAYRPLPDGDYIMAISLGERGVYAKRTDKSGAFLVAEITHIVKDPSAATYDGVPVDTNYVTSIYSERQGTSTLVDLLRCLGKPPARGLNLQQLGEFAKGVLGSGLLCKVRTKWEARSQEAQEAWDAGDRTHGRKQGVILRGQKSFPQNDKGEHVPMVECPVTGEEKQARPKVQGYFPLK